MPQSSRTFRIFISSTFSDLKAERSALQEFVFPRLRELACAHGCRFQAIDLRWGVSEEAGLDQQTMKICLTEVERCQKTSPRPNFLILLSDRFGWRPLPAEIPAAELDRLLLEMSPAEKARLLWREDLSSDLSSDRPDGENGWYRLDENAAAPVYVLQPRVRGTRFEEYEVWEREVERPLNSALLRAARAAGLEEADLEKYSASATQQEITRGALNAEAPQAHVFACFRSISNLPEAPAGFADLTQAGDFDEDASACQADLKRRLKDLLGENVSEYSAAWSNGGLTGEHIGSLPGSLEACLRLNAGARPAETLVEAVWLNLSRVILAELENLESVDALEKEQEAHLRFGESHTRSFFGRQDALEAVAAYLAGDDRRPLVIWGEPGSGKSALMARLSQGVALPGALTLTRFIGATPASTHGQVLLDGLCRQVSRLYQAGEGDLPTRYRDLVEEFPRRLALATAGRPLVLFLDALDQLSETDQAQGLAWLPATLPPHVKLVVSATPELLHGGLGEKAGIRLEVRPLQVAEGRRLLERWLEQAGRRLTPTQVEAVLTPFARSGLPLYLRLAFEEARLWKSYTPPPRLADDPTGLAQAFFKRLQLPPNGHGEKIVTRFLAYLLAAKNGLSEDEVLDLLSEDEEVMAEFYARSPKSPASSRLPVVVWARLFADLEPYLLEREADGTVLLGMYHRQIGEAARALLPADEISRAHPVLGRYFDRQDWWPDGVEGSQAPNLRKLAELPYQWAQAGDALELIPVLSSPDFFICFSDANRENYQELMEYWETARRLSAEIRLPGLSLKADPASFYRQAWSAVLDRPEYAIQAGRVGAFLIEMGQPEEADVFLQAEHNALTAHPAGELDPLAGPALLAANLIDQGQIDYRQENFTAAGEKYREAIRLLEGINSPEVAAAYCDLADVCIREKQFDQAQDLLDKALTLRKEHCGARSPETATVLQALGNLYLGQGLQQESLRSHQEALAIRRECLGQGHVDVGRSLYNVGAVLFNLKKYTASYQAVRQAREILVQAWGEADERVGMVDSLLGQHSRLREALRAKVSTTGILTPIWSGGEAGSAGFAQTLPAREALRQKLSLLVDEMLAHGEGLPILLLASPGFEALSTELPGILGELELPEGLVTTIFAPSPSAGQAGLAQPARKIDLQLYLELSRIPGKVAGWIEKERLEILVVSPAVLLAGFDWKLVSHAKACGKAMVSEMLPFGPCHGPLVGMRTLPDGQRKVGFMTLKAYQRLGYAPQPADSVSTGIFYLNLSQIRALLEESRKARGGLFKKATGPDLNKALFEKFSAALSELQANPGNGQEIVDGLFCDLVDIFGTALVQMPPDQQPGRVRISD